MFQLVRPVGGAAWTGAVKFVAIWRIPRGSSPLTTTIPVVTMANGQEHKRNAEVCCALKVKETTYIVA